MRLDDHAPSPERMAELHEMATRVDWLMVDRDPNDRNPARQEDRRSINLATMHPVGAHALAHQWHVDWTAENGHYDVDWSWRHEKGWHVLMAIMNKARCEESA